MENYKKKLEINRKIKIRTNLKTKLDKKLSEFLKYQTQLLEIDLLARELDNQFKNINVESDNSKIFIKKDKRKAEINNTESLFESINEKCDNSKIYIKKDKRKAEIDDTDSLFENIFEEANPDDQIDEIIENKIDEIKSRLKQSNVVILQGNTGCGKTTKVPRMLLNEYEKIVCTQPRRLAAINVAKKVASDLKSKVGDLVGYSIRFEKKISENTKLKFVTDGMLIKELQTKSKRKSQKVAGYDLIIIDEAHERTVNIDFLLGYLKLILQNPNIKTKLLIMSATLNVDRFLNFFKCPLVTVHHKSHDMQYFYLKEDIEKYLPICASTIKSIVSKEPIGDILVFLPGQEEIEKVYFLLIDSNINSKVEVLKLYSAMPADEQDLIFTKNGRKVILSTNIAETSITIENVRFVVECGKFKSNYYSASNCIDSLNTFDISKAQAKQRSGRAGRTQPGIIYRIYSHYKYLNMQENPTPEILRCKLHSLVLSMKMLGIININDFEFIDNPPRDCIKQAEIYLFYIRAIDENGIITSFGKRIANIPLDPEISVSLFAAKSIGCFNSVAIISAFLEYPSPFLTIRPDNYEYKSFKQKYKSLSDCRGNFYSFLMIFKLWQKHSFSTKFLNDNYLNIKTMNQILNIRNMLLRIFPECTDYNVNIEAAFCTGFFMKIAKKAENSYKTIFGDVECFIHPKEFAFLKDSKYIVYYEIFDYNKEYMRHCLEVKIDDIRKSINQYFKINTKSN